ncbi:MAG TPA: DUF1232 domain-containing protein [Anaeromyxobacteraceae bacterium]|nr:DUF1232 domain-containing protein [Anaeromyxobacteraceae bacterium]
MTPRPCPACGKPQGSNATCLSCRDAAAKELASAARDVTDTGVAERVSALDRLLDRTPWYARFAAGRLLTRLRLLRMVFGDCASGAYDAVPWRTTAACAAAVGYLILPVDRIPDFSAPSAGTDDDLLVLALAWGLVKRELREYCAWKGVSPAHFGL